MKNEEDFIKIIINDKYFVRRCYEEDLTKNLQYFYMFDVYNHFLKNTTMKRIGIILEKTNTLNHWNIFKEQYEQMLKDYFYEK